jgi:hypothetical protein
MKPQDNALPDTQQTALTTHEIMITGHHPDGKLDLKDASGNDVSTLTVNSDDDIIWTNADPEITIINIKEKFLTGNHFKNKPGAQAPNKWQGKVDSYNDHHVHISKYFIKWQDGSGNNTYDPLIRINPSQPIQ